MKKMGVPRTYQQGKGKSRERRVCLGRRCIFFVSLSSSHSWCAALYVQQFPGFSIYNFFFPHSERKGPSLPLVVPPFPQHTKPSFPHKSQADLGSRSCHTHADILMKCVFLEKKGKRFGHFLSCLSSLIACQCERVKGKKSQPPFSPFSSDPSFSSPFAVFWHRFPRRFSEKRKRSQKIVSQRTGNESKCFSFSFLLCRPLLKDVKKSGEIHVVLDCSTDKVQSVLKQAQQV